MKSYDLKLDWVLTLRLDPSKEQAVACNAGVRPAQSFTMRALGRPRSHRAKSAEEARLPKHVRANAFLRARLSRSTY
jgi:hypothetical protein